MTTTTEDIMKLAFNASHAETEHSADKWFAQLRTAVESLVAERDALKLNLAPVIQWLENGCDPKEAAKELRIYQDAIDAALRGQP